MTDKSLNEADYMELGTMGKTREILLGILRELMAIEERLANIEEKMKREG